MDMTRRKTLIKRRGIAKAKITSIKKFVDRIDGNIDMYSIGVRFEAIQQAWDDYNIVQDELEIEDEAEGSSHAGDREVVTELYYELHATMSRLVHTINVKAESLTKSPSSNSTQANTNLRLTPIKLPVFNNKPTEFKRFFNTFNSLVLNNEPLDNIQRYYYLLSVVSGEAHELIENLPVTADNSPIAWKLICDRYDNPRLIANAHVRVLLSPPVVSKECPQTLRSLLNHCKSNVNAIEALNLNVPGHELIITQLCLEKIDSNTRKD